MIDEICDRYDVEFDLNKRAALMRDLDGILTSQYQHINTCTFPPIELPTANRYGMPKDFYSRFGDNRGHSGRQVFLS